MEDLSLTDLMERCRAETDKYHTQLPSNPAYCLELFRRALRRTYTDTDAAWRALIEAFTDQVERWFYTHRAFRSAIVHADAATYVHDAFSRLFLRNTKEPLVFHELGQALFFLKRCLNTAIYDELRHPLPLPSPANPEEEEATTGSLDWVDAEELWQKILLCTRSTRERRVVHLLWVEEYKPQQIVMEFPEEFPEVWEIHRIRANVLARLVRRFPDLKPGKRPGSEETALKLADL